MVVYHLLHPYALTAPCVFPLFVSNFQDRKPHSPTVSTFNAERLLQQVKAYAKKKLRREIRDLIEFVRISTAKAYPK